MQLGVHHIWRLWPNKTRAAALATASQKWVAIGSEQMRYIRIGNGSTCYDCQLGHTALPNAKREVLPMVCSDLARSQN